jgi:hypothetical protein
MFLMKIDEFDNWSYSSVGIAMIYGLDGRGSIPGREKRFFFTASGPAPGLTHSPVQCVPGAFPPWVKRPGREADHLHLVPMSRMVEFCLHSSTDLHGTVLN